jgi:hypothetical protein
MSGARRDLPYQAPGQLDNVHRMLYDAGGLGFQGNGMR